MSVSRSSSFSMQFLSLAIVFWKDDIQSPTGTSVVDPHLGDQLLLFLLLMRSLHPPPPNCSSHYYSDYSMMTLLLSSVVLGARFSFLAFSQHPDRQENENSGPSHFHN